MHARASPDGDRNRACDGRHGRPRERGAVGHRRRARRSHAQPHRRGARRRQGPTACRPRRPADRAHHRPDRVRLPHPAGRRGRLGEWLQVSTETAGDRRRAWIRASQVRLRDTDYRVVVSRSARRLELLRGSRVVFRTRVAVGSTAHPTPTGRFGVTDKLTGRRFGNVYGCCILAISAIQAKLPRELARRQPDRSPRHEHAGHLGNPVSTGCVRVRRAAAARVDTPRPARDARDHPRLNRYPTPRTVSSAPGAVAELAPQARDRDVDDVRAARPLVAPHVAQERVACDRLPLAGDQVAHHLALELGECDPVTVEAQLAGGLVKAGRGQVEVACGEVGEPADG